MTAQVNLKHRIELIASKKMVGKRMTISFSCNKTGELWRSFMQGRKEIQSIIGTELYSIQIYDPLFFRNFNPDAAFEKWAAIEVSDFETVPGEMEAFTLNGGLYAVFLYKGAAGAAAKTFENILMSWLPGSEFALDNRPHFEVLGEKYKNDDPGSEEEIWIPVTMKV